MYTIEVIPITKGILKEKLTYFSNKDIPLGAIVEVPLRRKTVKALVSGKTKVIEIKSQLKKADFAVKKIKSVKVKKFLPTAFVESVEEASNYFASSTGAILNNLVSKQTLERADKLRILNTNKDNPKDRHEKLLLQAGEDERFSTYRNLIREEFAKNLSVIFIVPTIEELNRSKKILEKGIENFVFCFNSSMTGKEIEKNWNEAVSLKHPALIITTAQFMHLPRSDFGTMIVERENSSAYKDLRRPYLDIRTFAEIFSKKLGIRLLFGDFFLRTETLWRQENLDFSELIPLKFRILTNAKQNLVDLRDREKETKEKGFYLLSNMAKDILEESQKNKETTFVFGARKGLSPLLSCLDCGQIMECSNCSAPIVLHEENNERKISCHKCGLKKKAVDKCKNCGGWRIQGFGVGLEALEKEIKKTYPKASVFRLDKEKAKTGKRAVKIISDFLKTPGSILVSNEMAVFYLNKKIDNVICASTDSLFSIPDFRINERIFSLLLRLKNLSANKFLIQTRLPDLPLWQYLLSGNLIDFYRSELEARREFNYPPFSLFIKIVIQSSKKEIVETEAEKIREKMAEYQSVSYPAFTSKIKGKHLMNVLLKIDPKKWPDSELVERLRELPPNFLVKVDPENIL